MILDLQMPNWGGYSIIKEVQQEGYQKTPILVLSGKNMDPGTVEIIRGEPNVRGLCKKPIAIKELKKVVHSLMGTTPPARFTDPEMETAFA